MLFGAHGCQNVMGTVPLTSHVLRSPPLLESLQGFNLLFVGKMILCSYDPGSSLRPTVSNFVILASSNRDVLNLKLQWAFLHMQTTGF